MSVDIKRILILKATTYRPERVVVEDEVDDALVDVALDVVDHDLRGERARLQRPRRLVRRVRLQHPRARRRAPLEVAVPLVQQRQVQRVDLARHARPPHIKVGCGQKDLARLFRQSACVLECHPRSALRCGTHARRKAGTCDMYSIFDAMVSWFGSMH